MSALQRWHFQIQELDERVRPIAQRPVDMMHEGWVERLRSKPQPLDEAGVRSEVERLLTEMSAAYTQGPEETRASIRRSFSEHRSFSWAAEWSRPQPGVEGLRQRLILFSMQDQGQDSRDALLALQEICRAAAAKGVDAAPERGSRQQPARWASPGWPTILPTPTLLVGAIALR